MKSKFRMLRVGLSLGCAVAALPAYAQQSAEPAADAAADAASGDIIVTAQRRSESLSKTPVAVAVVSAETLAKSQIVSEQDLRTATPGLTVKGTSAGNQLNYAIRGISIDPYSGSRPGVLPYINEVQIGGVGGASAFYDLQSIQVLKGPQGTLFGRSATGGAVLFTTAAPTNEFGGYISLLGGNYKAKKIEGALNVPIINDTLMARVAGFWSERDGFQKNLFYGDRLGGYERYGFRGSVALETGGLTNNLVVDYFNTKGSNGVAVVSEIVPNAFPIAALYAGVATPADRATGIGTVQAFLAGFGPAAVASVPAFYDAYFAVPNRRGLAQHVADQNARGPYTVSSNGLNVFTAKNLIVTNKTTLEIGDNTEIRNIIGYTHLKTFLAIDDGLPYGLAENGVPGGSGGIPNLTKQFSEELQVAGKTFDDRLTYVVGGYYSDESFDNTNNFTSLDILLGGFPANFHYELQNKTYAGYAQGTYALNDSGLSVTLGGRYTSEKVRKILFPDDTNRIGLGNPAPAGFSYDKSATFNKFSWTVGVQNQFNANTLLYVASRRGYKSGTFNGAAPPRDGLSTQGGDGVDAEQVTDVELGLKHQDNSGVPKRINIAAFHNWLKNRQSIAYFLTPSGAAASATVNVPNAKIYGLEVDGSIGPISGFTLGGTFNYTHARFGSEPVVVPGAAAPVQYNTFPDTPELSGSAYGQFATPVSGTIEASFRGEVYAQSKVFTHPRRLGSAGSIIPGYALVNFRVGLEDDEAGWSLTANLKNAFNKVHYVGGIPLGEILAFNTRLPGDPRTVTVEARFKF